MERLLQYLDDIDDLVGVFGLSYESIRRLLLKLLALSAGMLALAAGFLLTVTFPPVAMGIGLLLVAILVYRMFTASPNRRLRQV
jgi:hypothetical protein